MANLASISFGKLKASASAKTAAPAKPTAPTKSVAPAKPTAPAKSTAPTKPVAPARPATPAKPAVAAKPAAPVEAVAVSDEERSFALAFLASLATEVSKGTVNLPSFPDVVMRIRKALAEPNVRLSEIVKIVGTEPRLSARLLQVANSAAYNPAGKHLIDLRAAITRLGHRPVQSAVMAFAVKQVRLAPGLRSISNHLNILWELSISVAAICQVIARRSKVSPEEAFLTGLLHGIGRLYIMVRSAGTSEKLFQNPAFRDMIAGWHPAIGKAVLENWGFDEAMCVAVADQGDFEHTGRSEPDLTDVLVVSVVLARVLRRPGPRSVDMDGINSFGRLHMTSQDCSEVLRHAEHQLGSLHAALGC